MAEQIQPRPQLEFHGVYTAGNPARRPPGTAAKCENFRVMPGYWLRLRAGRKARCNTDGTIQQVQPLRKLGPLLNDYCLVQIKIPNAVKWHRLHLSSYVIDPSYTELIYTGYDGAFGQNNPVAITNDSDRPVFYNGLGNRTGGWSLPPFSTCDADGLILRYFGLDAYCENGNPTVLFTQGSGENQVLDRVHIYVGLYNFFRGHHSNGVYAGTITTTNGKGTIKVQNLGRLLGGYHDTWEMQETFYVFYATVDGGEVPRPILDPDLIHYYLAPMGSSEATLSLAPGTTNGWVLDPTKACPFENHPPRPMRSICMANGRLYGVLMAGGYGNAIPQKRPGSDVLRPDFSYVVSSPRDFAAVVASAVPGAEEDFLGNPLESWPLGNIYYTPSGDQPLVVVPAFDNVMVLVITTVSTFLLQEQSDGLHEYVTVSRTHGIRVPATLRLTRYGWVWIDQRNHIVRLVPGTAALEILSGNYANLLAGKTPRCADYLLDPVNEIDRYQVWFTDGTSVIHDFAIGGEGYSTNAEDFTAASTLTDPQGRRYHIVAKTGLYTQEGQPDDGLPVTTDDTFTEGQNYTTAEINGEYMANWLDFGDPSVRKEFAFMDAIADGAKSAALDASPLSLDWYADFEEVCDANKKSAVPTPTPQSETNSSYRLKLARANRFRFKLDFKLAGHSGDDASFIKHQPPATQGDRAKNFYGSILQVLYQIAATENRP